MGALFNTVNHPRGAIKWPLVAHTVTMFSVLTVSVLIFLEIQSVANIDNRGTPGGEDLSFPGPLIFQDFIYSKANGVVLATTIFLNTCLADGLLVSLAFNPVPQVPDAGYSSSYVVAMSFTQGTTGSSPSHALCTLPL